MAAVPVGEQLLVGRLESIVELLAEASADLFDERLRVEVLVQHGRRQHRHVERVEVGPDGLLDARILHLDRNREPVVRHRAMHLADRRRGDRHRIPFGEQAIRRKRRDRLRSPRPRAPHSSAARPLGVARAPAAQVRACRRPRSWRSGRASSARPSCFRAWPPRPRQCAARVRCRAPLCARPTRTRAERDSPRTSFRRGHPGGPSQRFEPPGPSPAAVRLRVDRVGDAGRRQNKWPPPQPRSRAVARPPSPSVPVARAEHIYTASAVKIEPGVASERGEERLDTAHERWDQWWGQAKLPRIRTRRLAHRTAPSPAMPCV